MASVKTFSLEELSRYNGQGGAPAYVAFEGKVYDVTESFSWPEGLHAEVHQAGADLTAALEDAPHAAEVLEAFPVVGELAQD